MFVEVQNNAVVTWPYDYDTLTKKNPYTKFAADTDLLTLYNGTEDNLSGKTLEIVAEAPQPSFDPASQAVVQDAQPAFTNGKWVLGWTVRSLSQQEQADATAQKSASVRNVRNDKLKESDWTQLADCPVNKDAWAIYRQTLRDITVQPGFPWAVNWPVKPE